MRWYGTFDGETLVGVMGLERRGMAALCRHAYVLSACRRRGIGARRREHLEAVAAGAERSMTGPQRAAMLTPTTRDGRWPERKVKQILLNLLANAVKFTPERCETTPAQMGLAVECVPSASRLSQAPTS